MGKHVGQYLHQLRETEGLGLRQLASQIGLSASHLSMVEHGQRETSVVVLYDIVKRLDGDFITALRRMALDIGIPPKAIAPELHPHDV